MNFKDYLKKGAPIVLVLGLATSYIGCSKNKPESGSLNKPYENILKNASIAVSKETKNRLDLAQEHLDTYLTDRILSGSEGEKLDEEVEEIYGVIDKTLGEFPLLREDKKRIRNEWTNKVKESRVGKFEDSFSDPFKMGLENFLEKEYGQHIDVYGFSDAEEVVLTFVAALVGAVVITAYVNRPR